MKWRGASAAVVIAGFVGALGALAAAGEEGESPARQAGHNLYSEHCQVCHGVGGIGNGPLASELRVRPADLTQIAQRRGGVFPDVEIREIVDGRRHVRGHGPEDMPVWGEVFRQQAAGATYESDVRDRVESLVTYLKSIQKAAPVAPGEKKSGS
ncbi:MAG TPA: cytochrome c [Myxococcota bacterium]|nr:cytochrome c [Myxococcota bacterium]